MFDSPLPTFASPPSSHLSVNTSSSAHAHDSNLSSHELQPNSPPFPTQLPTNLSSPRSPFSLTKPLSSNHTHAPSPFLQHTPSPKTQNLSVDSNISNLPIDALTISQHLIHAYHSFSHTPSQNSQNVFLSASLRFQELSSHILLLLDETSHFVQSLKDQIFDYPSSQKNPFLKKQLINAQIELQFINHAHSFIQKNQHFLQHPYLTIPDKKT